MIWETSSLILKITLLEKRGAGENHACIRLESIRIDREYLPRFHFTIAFHVRPSTKIDVKRSTIAEYPRCFILVITVTRACNYRCDSQINEKRIKRTFDR